MPENGLSTTAAAELVSALKGYQFLADYSLAVYSPEELEEASLPPGRQLCGVMTGSALCHKLCALPLKQAAQEASASDRPVVFRCRVDCSVSPSACDPVPAAWIGGGIREPLLDVRLLNALQETTDLHHPLLVQK